MEKLFGQVRSELFSDDVLDAMGKATGAIKRVRKLNGKTLLDMLLFDPDQSYNGISLQLMQRNGVNISKQALQQKHKGQMGGFIKAAFERILSVSLPEKAIKGMEVCIKDSTRFALPPNMAELYPGNQGAGMKAGAAVQFEFGIKSGKSSIKLTASNIYDQHESNLDKETICSGVVYMRDLGYAHQGYMSNIHEKGAFFINKLTPKTLIYTLEESSYRQLDLKNIRGVFDGQVYIGEEKMPVRIIIEPVSDELRNKRITTVEKYNKRKGSKTSGLFKCRAGFNFIVTNLATSEYSAELIQKLYHLRWQIELVFKAWKSFLKINYIRKTSIDRIFCILYSKLVWAVLSWKICMAIDRIGRISILKIHSFIASTKEALRDQLWNINTGWLQKLEQTPFSRIQKEQKKHRLKIQKLILST